MKKHKNLSFLGHTAEGGGSCREQERDKTATCAAMYREKAQRVQDYPPVLQTEETDSGQQKESYCNPCLTLVAQGVPP